MTPLAPSGSALVGASAFTVAAEWRWRWSWGSIVAVPLCSTCVTGDDGCWGRHWTRPNSINDSTARRVACGGVGGFGGFGGLWRAVVEGRGGRCRAAVV